MFSKDLELDLLRAFVAVVDGAGFTRAAERLHRTQSTVSQQLKRLEDRVGAPLLTRNTRSITLTEHGELLLGYARRLLALSDEALSVMDDTRMQGRVRLGSAQEVADGGLAELLAQFSRLHPGVTLEVRVEANLKLREEIERGNLDLAVLFQEQREVLGGGVKSDVIERMRHVWVASPEFQLPANDPLPLIVYNSPCLFRNAVIGALDAIDRPWRIVLSTPSLAGLRAALRAGLGIGARTERWLDSDLHVLGQELPPLPDVELVLLSASNVEDVVIEKMRRILVETLTGPAYLINKGLLP